MPEITIAEAVEMIKPLTIELSSTVAISELATPSGALIVWQCQQCLAQLSLLGVIAYGMHLLMPNV
jgi:ribose/xylose/arabinose/galactoside ABC-type transport system permease subunit